MALYGYAPKRQDALIIHSGHYASHVIPYVNGKVVLDHTKRVSLGGFHSEELMTKSLSLRYP